MSIILFIVILAVLIIVHEYGHFIVAKKNNIRVDEFGLGYPPRAKVLFRRKGTDFTLNWLPFGGFVKIFGENPDDEALSGLHKSQALVNKSRWTQAAVLFAGPFFNFLFAWLLVLITLFVGFPTSVDPSLPTRFVHDQQLIITDISSGSPAELAGLQKGFVINAVSVGGQRFDTLDSGRLRELVLQHQQDVFTLDYSTEGNIKTATLKPAAQGGNEKLLGIALENRGVYKPSFGRALTDSFVFTGRMIRSIASALWGLVQGLFTGGADISNLTGPIGIVGLVGDASKEGLTYLLTFTALISINLGIINLIPFPALDGGRLLFLGLEKLKGGRINYKILNILNLVGFGLLILLMVFISYHDILRIFHP